MSQVYNIISIVAYSLAGVFFLVSVFLWFKFNIWDIIGDLSGRNAKKSIKQMRQENENASVNLYRHSGTYGSTGNSGEIGIRQNSTRSVTEEMQETGDEKTAILNENALMDGDDATTILDDGATELLDGGATELLDDGATELLDDGATELLDDNATELLDEGTTVLTDTPGDLQKSVAMSKWTILQSIVLIHTDEEIA